MSSEMVIFTRTYDLLLWLLPKTEHFPKLYRSSITQRLLDATLNFQVALLEAQTYQDKIRLRHLRQADTDLNKIRVYLRLVHQWSWLSLGQYEHVSRMVAEIGRLLGGGSNRQKGINQMAGHTNCFHPCFVHPWLISYRFAL